MKSVSPTPFALAFHPKFMNPKVKGTMADFSFDSGPVLPNTPAEATAQGNPPQTSIPEPVIPSAPIDSNTVGILQQLLQQLQTQQAVNPPANTPPAPTPVELNPMQRLERLENAVDKIVQAIRSNMGHVL